MSAAYDCCLPFSSSSSIIQSLLPFWNKPASFASKRHRQKTTANAGVIGKALVPILPALHVERWWNWTKPPRQVLTQLGACETRIRHFRKSVNTAQHCSSGNLDELICQLDSDADVAAYASLLKRCTVEMALSQGARVHEHMTRGGYADDRFLNNLLVRMYGNCGSLQDARAVFDNVGHPNLYSWTIMLAACTQNRQGEEALQLFAHMQAQGFEPDMIAFICVLDACASVAALKEGREIHSSIVCNRWESNVVVGNALLNMYGKCQMLDDARGVFAEMPQRDVISYSAMIAACVHNGHGKEALGLFGQMKAENIIPNEVTFASVFDACACEAALEEGRETHASAVCEGFESDVVVLTALVYMYGKFGSLDDARAVFVKMQGWNVVSWNAMISVCTQNGHGNEALQVFGQMLAEGFLPDEVTFVCALDASACTAAIQEGREIHASVVCKQWESVIFVGNALINMYGKCWNLNDAWAVFAGMSLKDVVTWSAMMAVCAQNGHGKEALQLFSQMQDKGFVPDEVTFSCAIDACAIEAALEDGRENHAIVVRNGWESDVVVGNALINMYGKCGSLDDAWAMFVQMPQKDVVTWTAMANVCTQNGRGNDALQLFGQMQAESIKLNEITFICILNTCASVAALEEGREIHAIVVVNGWESDNVVGAAIVNMYGNCWNLDDARAVFTQMTQLNVAFWNAMIAQCVLNEHCKEAIQLFGQMQSEAFEPNEFTFIYVLDACGSMAAIEEGREVHSAVVANGWDVVPPVGNALVNMYGKGGSLDDARAVFLEMPLQDVIMYTAMITVCVLNGHGKEALQLFDQMQAKGLEPNEITFCCILDACASMAALEEGREIHARVIGSGWETYAVVGTALANMYSKCHSLDCARAVFAETPCQDLSPGVS